MSLKTRLAAIVLLLFLASIWLLTFLTNARLQEDFTEVLSNQQFSAVSHTAMQIEETVRLRFEALESIAREITPRLLANPTQLRQLLAVRPLLQTLFGNGVVVISRDGMGIVGYPHTPGREGSNYKDVEYYRHVMATGRVAVGKPRIGRLSGEPGVGFAVPILGPNHEILGVFAGLSNLSDQSLFGHIEHANVGRTGWIAISSPRDRLIVTASDIKRQLETLPAPGVNPMLDKFVDGYQGSGISVNSRGIVVLTSARQVPSTGWFVQMVLPVEEAFAPLHALKTHAYAIAGALSALVTLLVWLTLRILLQPLRNATQVLHEMTAGHRELTEMPITRRDEVGALLSSFNSLVAQRRKLEDDLEQLAHTDALTGLGNRRHFIELATQEVARTLRYGDGRLTVLMLDVDHFKKINDTYGHQVGDVVLQRLADTCRATLREIDIVARYGGEEFAILLPETEGQKAFEVAERLRQALAATQIVLDQGLPLGFTVSIGVAFLGGTRMNVDTLLNRADLALYEAKRMGRNCVRGAQM